MKKVFLLMVVPVLLVALGLAQTPAASGNTDPVNVKGCVSGSEGNYTVAEDNTGQIFKITSSSVDLKAHLGHEVKLVGHKASGAAGSGAAENSLAVSEVTMISEHCTPAGAAAAIAPAATVGAPAETTVPPAAAVPAATASTPAETAVAPAATIPMPAETVTTPAAAAPAAVVSTPAEPAVVAPAEPVITPPAAAAAPTEIGTPVETASTPAAATAHARRQSAHPPRSAATPPAKPAETASTPIVPTDATPAAAGSTPAVSDSVPAAAATTPAAAPATTPATKAWSGSLWILVSFVVVVLLIGAMVPMVNRWKKRRLLEQAGEENLSFSHRASSDPGRSDKPAGRKAA